MYIGEKDLEKITGQKSSSSVFYNFMDVITYLSYVFQNVEGSDFKIGDWFWYFDCFD